MNDKWVWWLVWGAIVSIPVLIAVDGLLDRRRRKASHVERLVQRSHVRLQQKPYNWEDEAE